MRVAIVTHAPRGSRSGNRVTAERWARALRALGHDARVGAPHADPPCDALVVLHAVRCAEAVLRSKRRHPSRPVVVALTGTDLDPALRSAVRPVLERADRIVVLQPYARQALPARALRKTRVILQAVALPRSTRAPRTRPRKAPRLRVVALSHLRAVKDPLLLPRALDLLPGTSRVRATHVGGALEAAVARKARAVSASHPRWRWIGERPRAAALARLARSDLFVLTSQAEGGPGVLGEAATLGVPILATRIPGVVGVLGRRHPGLFAAGSARALARALRRFEGDAVFRRRLTEASRRVATRLSPSAERRAWRTLLAGLETNRTGAGRSGQRLTPR